MTGVSLLAEMVNERSSPTARLRLDQTRCGQPLMRRAGLWFPWDRAAYLLRSKYCRNTEHSLHSGVTTSVGCLFLGVGQ